MFSYYSHPLQLVLVAHQLVQAVLLLHLDKVDQVVMISMGNMVNSRKYFAVRCTSHVIYRFSELLFQVRFELL